MSPSSESTAAILRRQVVPPGPCRTRSAGRSGAVLSARGTAGTYPWSPPSACRACAASRCASSNVDVLDLA